MSTLRLQKYLSECGICSRRHAEDAIRNGEVMVNGVPAVIWQSIDPLIDTVKFSWRMVAKSESLVYYAVNKPRGIESTCAQKNGQSIIDIVDIPVRVFPIGRLDKDSSGLILLTNDGRLTHRLLHPSFEHEKEYLVTTYGKIDDMSLKQMAQGMRYVLSEGPKSTTKDKENTKWRIFNDRNNSDRVPMSKGDIWKTAWFQPKKFVQTQPCEIKRVSSDTFCIILKEWKNRQIRRMVEACGHQVKKLKRIRIEHILLSDMPDGAYRELKRGEREELLRRWAIPLIDATPIVGEVIHGNGIGKKYGFPTANIAYAPNVLENKTYSCRVTLRGTVYLGAGSYQVEKWHFEVHILGFDEDIYGEVLHVEIMDVIRDNHPFASPDALIQQIQKDVNHVRSHWKSVLEDTQHKKNK